MSGLHDTRVGDKQRARTPQLFRHRAKLVDRSFARHHAYRQIN
jgi:hypothetical protein